MRIEDRTRIGRMRRTRWTSWAASSVYFLVLIGLAEDIQAFSAANIYRNTAASVVLIIGFSDSGAGSSGTGSIITHDGVVLTNSHVITNADTGRLYRNLVVYLKPKEITGDHRKDLSTPFLVDVIARDPDLDLALLRIQNAPSTLRPVEIGDSEEVEIGESVAVIGHPGGGGLWTLTTGTISSKRRDSSRDVFQTDAAVNPGNSGGPLFDAYSRLVGVNTFVRRVNDQGLPLEGLNYSLRSAFALAWINQRGVVRVSAVSRASTRAPNEGEAPAPSRSSTLASPPVRQPTPRFEPAPKRGLVQLLGLQTDPSPSLPESAPREFEGRDGETMYGVPNPEIDLHDALIHARKGYQVLIERADESVGEMHRLLDDYDDF